MSQRRDVVQLGPFRGGAPVTPQDFYTWEVEREARKAVLLSKQVRSWEDLAHNAVTAYLLREQGTNA